MEALNGNPIAFWATATDNKYFRGACAMARAVLAIPSTEAASERVFKQAKATRTALRTRLLSVNAEAQVIVGRALCALGITSPRNMAVALKELEL